MTDTSSFLADGTFGGWEFSNSLQRERELERVCTVLKSKSFRVFRVRTPHPGAGRVGVGFDFQSMRLMTCLADLKTTGG